jgi:hypothetical protein
MPCEVPRVVHCRTCHASRRNATAPATTIDPRASAGVFTGAGCARLTDLRYDLQVRRLRLAIRGSIREGALPMEESQLSLSSVAEDEHVEFWPGEPWRRARSVARLLVIA